VVVTEKSVHVMNVAAVLRSEGIDANGVVLAVLTGMCSRVGADSDEYRETQGGLSVPAGKGSIACAFAAVTAALPQATVLMSATGFGKEQAVRNVSVWRTVTWPML